MSRTPSWIGVGVGFVVGAVCLLLAVIQFNDYVQNPEPLRMSLAEYIRTRPSNKWIELSDCTIAYSRGVGYRAKLGHQVRYMSVPVFPTGDSRGPVPMILNIAAVNVQADAGRKDEYHATVSGMVRSGVFANGFDEKLKAIAPWTLADGYTEVNEDFSPSSGVWALGVGVFLMAWCAYWSFILRQRARQPAPVAAAGYLEEPEAEAFPDPMATLAEFAKTNAAASSATPVAWRGSESQSATTESR